MHYRKNFSPCSIIISPAPAVTKNQESRTRSAKKLHLDICNRAKKPHPRHVRVVRPRPSARPPVRPSDVC